LFVACPKGYGLKKVLKFGGLPAPIANKITQNFRVVNQFQKEKRLE